MHKIYATIYRDFKEYLANYSVFTLFLMPIGMAVIYRMIGQDVGEALPNLMVFIIIGIVLAGVTTNVPLTLFADEIEHGMIRMVVKDKKDLLLMIVGRSALVILMSILLIIASLLIVDRMSILSLSLALGLFLAMLVFLNLGILAGIRSKLETTSTVAGVIILFLLGMTPIVESMGLTNISFIKFLIDLTPVYQLIAIQNNASVMPFIILLVWLGVTMFLIFRSLDIHEKP
jgi:hypothetical protein